MQEITSLPSFNQHEPQQKTDTIKSKIMALMD